MLVDSPPNVRYRAFLVSAVLIAIIFAAIATSRYGAGVSSDAARNLSTADNLMAGRGFVDMVGSPFVLWPPLYPILLAGLSLMSATGTFQVAWYLNVVLFGINVGLAGWWLWTVFRGKPLLAVVGTLIVLLSRSLLRIHANVASEPLFESLLFVFLLSAARYLQSGSGGSLWLMCIAAGLATVQRYLGVVLLGVAIIVIFRGSGWQGLRRAALPWLLSAAPMVGWAALHNYPISGSPFGPRELGAMLPFQNIGLGLTKILWWFIPRWGPLDWLILRPWIFLLALGLGLVVLNGTRRWSDWVKHIGHATFWPALLFAVSYFFLLAFTVVTADHLDLTSDRYYVVLLPIVVALGLSALDALVISHLSTSKRGVRWALGLVVLLWFVYPVYAVQSYLRQSLIQGEPTNYNIANSAQFREMSVVKAAQQILARDPEALIYTNYVNIVWFLFDHPVQPLPFAEQELSRSERLEAVQRNYPHWPEQRGYIVWFTPNQYHHIVAPNELRAITNLQLLYEDETGQIFLALPAN